jgi:hypothetical protein
MNRYRHLILLAVVVCATAIAVSIFGVRVVGFDAGTATILIGVHVAIVAAGICLRRCVAARLRRERASPRLLEEGRYSRRSQQSRPPG